MEIRRRGPCGAVVALVAAGVALGAGIVVGGCGAAPLAPTKPIVVAPVSSTPPSIADPCGGRDIDLSVAVAACRCASGANADGHACEGASDNGSANLLVKAVPKAPSVAPGATIDIELVLENHGSEPLRVDLPPGFAPELVAFSPVGVRIEPPNGTPACPLNDTLRFVSGRIRVRIFPGGRAHLALPWNARSVEWDESRRTEGGRCAMRYGAPLILGTYELKVIADLLGIASDDPARNPRVHVLVQ